MKKFVFFAFLLALASCGSNAPKHQAEPLRIGTTVVAPASDIATRIYVGTIEEERSVALSFPLGGTVARSLVSEGEFVKKGQLLAELDLTSAQQTYDAAEATLTQAQDAYARLKQLYDAESLPEIKWVEVQTQLRKAEAAFQIAQKNLNDCTITAPFAGVVGKRMKEAGEQALPGMPVISLLDISKVKVSFPVPEQEISSINAESRISIVVAALGDKKFEATNPEKSIVADLAAHSYKVRAEVVSDNHELLPGMVCRVVVAPEHKEGKAEEYVLPLSAVREDGNGTHFVWLVEDDHVTRHNVEVGRMIDNGIIIREGLTTGDRVVSDGIQKIGEGSKVVW